jgi:hypothetical protein
MQLDSKTVIAIVAAAAAAAPATAAECRFKKQYARAVYECRQEGNGSGICIGDKFKYFTDYQSTSSDQWDCYSWHGTQSAK